MIFPNIEKERERMNLSKDKFAEKLGITRQTYYNWIRGKNPIPSDVLIRMSDVTGASIDYLLGREKSV